MALGDAQKHCLQPFSLTKIVSIVSLIYKKAFRQFHCAFLYCSSRTTTQKNVPQETNCDLVYKFVLKIENGQLPGYTFLLDYCIGAKYI